MQNEKNYKYTSDYSAILNEYALFEVDYVLTVS